jgi:hypothetical protein
MIVKHELMKQGMGWSKFLVANEFENIEDAPRNIVGNIPDDTAKVQEVHEIPRQGIENNTRTKRKVKINEVGESSFQPKLTRAMT